MNCHDTNTNLKLSVANFLVRNEHDCSFISTTPTHSRRHKNNATSLSKTPTSPPPSRTTFPDYSSLFLRKNIKLEVGKFLGAGGFGSVFEGKLFGRKIALKRIHQNTKNPHAIRESFNAEKAAMSLRHRNIVRIIAATDLSDDFISERLVLMEYAGHRNLLSIINDENERISESQRLKYASDIANALYYIHKKNIAHLDVKPANIMVSFKNLCKLGDFGCCKVLSESSGEGSPTTPTTSYLTGTLAYRSPELLKGNVIRHTFYLCYLCIVMSPSTGESGVSSVSL